MADLNPIENQLVTSLNDLNIRLRALESSSQFIKGNAISVNDQTLDVSNSGTINVTGSGAINVSGSGAVNVNGTGAVNVNSTGAIKNTSGTNIVDSVGAVSTNIFASGITTSTSATNYNDTNWHDVMSLTFTLSRTQNILFTATMNGASDNDGTNTSGTLGQILLDGVQIGGTGLMPGKSVVSGIMYDTASISTIELVSAGTHTVKTQFAGWGTTSKSPKFYISANKQTLLWLSLGN